MSDPNFDVATLRALVKFSQLKAMGAAAQSVGRTQSALSQQFRKLEHSVGRKLFDRTGRGLSLTDDGELVLKYAKRIILLNDEAVIATRSPSRMRTVRLAVPADLAGEPLRQALTIFREKYPDTYVDLRVGFGRDLTVGVDTGELDLVIAFDAPSREGQKILKEVPTFWYGIVNNIDENIAPINFVFFHAPCPFRKYAVDALIDARKNWHVAYSTTSLDALWSGVGAGMGVTLRTSIGVPSTLERVISRYLPATPPISLTINHKISGMRSEVEQLMEIITEIMQETPCPTWMSQD